MDYVDVCNFYKDKTCGNCSKSCGEREDTMACDDWEPYVHIEAVPPPCKTGHDVFIREFYKPYCGDCYYCL